MRFFDIFKISVHNIFHNKVRTLITLIIVLVVSLLLMIISVLGLSFTKSINNAFMDVYDKSGSQFRLDSYNSYIDDVSTYRGINKAEYEIVMEQFKDRPELIDNIKLENFGMEVFHLADLTEVPDDDDLGNDLYNTYYEMRYEVRLISSWGDLDYQSKGVSYLKSGKLWNKEDDGLKKVWVSDEFIAKASLFGKQLKVGDNVIISTVYHEFDKDTQNYQQIVNSEKLRISGIFLKEALEELDYSQDVFVDINTMYGIAGDKVELNGLTIVNEAKVGYIFNDEYKNMKTIVDNINAQIEPNIYNKRKNLRFDNDIVNELKNTKIMSAVLIGAAFFIEFIILIISIGSVANTIIISVDKNKRFLGVMMAVGLKKGGVKRIVQFETLITIIVATGISYLLLIILSRLFLPVMKSLLLSLGFTVGSVIVMPIYIPLITIFAFVFMSLLFAKKSLQRITNMDVISVISEVS